jgi:hypothetical protein
MPWEHIIYAALIGWGVAALLGRRPIKIIPGDGWPDGYCPPCAVVIGAIGGWVMVQLTGDALGHDILSMTLEAAAGGAFAASAYNVASGAFGKRAPNRVSP